MEKNKIAVINFSGNVGKSSMVKHLLRDKMPNAEVISVETLNDGLQDYEADKIKGKYARTIFERVMLADEIIVDVGSSKGVSN